jgi:hypothetical protein
MNTETTQQPLTGAAAIKGAELSQAQRTELMAANPNVPSLAKSNLQGFDGIAEAVSAGVFVSADNFGSDKMRRFQLTGIATSGDSARLDDMHGQVITPRYWYCHTVELANEANTATSKGVFNSLRVIWDHFGSEALPDGLKLEVVRQATRSGYKTLLLKPVIDGPIR